MAELKKGDRSTVIENCPEDRLKASRQEYKRGDLSGEDPSGNRLTLVVVDRTRKIERGRDRGSNEDRYYTA